MLSGGMFDIFLVGELSGGTLDIFFGGSFVLFFALLLLLLLAELPVFVGVPIVFPAVDIEKFFPETATVDVDGAAHAGDETFDVAFTFGGEFVGGIVGVAAHAFAGDDKAGINNDADERDAFVGVLFVLLFGVEREAEFVEEEFANNLDVAQELFFFRFGDDDEEIVDIAAVVFVAEVEADEAVELVEEDVGKELGGEIADDDALAGRLEEEAFVAGKVFPIGALAANGDVFHGLVENDFVPEIFEGLIEFATMFGLAANADFVVGAAIVEKLLV